MFKIETITDHKSLVSFSSSCYVDLTDDIQLLFSRFDEILYVYNTNTDEELWSSITLENPDDIPSAVKQADKFILDELNISISDENIQKFIYSIYNIMVTTYRECYYDTYEKLQSKG